MGRKFVRDSNPEGGKYQCPVCGKYTLDSIFDYDICDVCGWHDDDVSFECSDIAIGPNRVSLNQMREAYAKGMTYDAAVKHYRPDLQG